MPGLLDLQPAVTRNNDLLRSQVINIYRYKSAKIKSKLRKRRPALIWPDRLTEELFELAELAYPQKEAFSLSEVEQDVFQK